MEPVRILQVVTIMNRGGLETMLMNYYRQVDKKKIQFDFLVHRLEAGHYDNEICNLGGRIYRMPAIKPGNYRKYFALLDEFFESHSEYSVVHSHINENSSFVLRAAKKAGIPCRIIHSHLSDLGIDYKLPFRLYARYTIKDCPSNYFACSKKAGEWLFGRKSSSNGVTVLNNAVNTEEFKFNENIRTEIRRELDIKEHQLVIGHIGRFNKQKNHEFLIDVFQKVKEQNESAVLILVGEGHLRPQMERKVEQLVLTPFVKFLGVRKDIPHLMQAMDLFLFPSLFEGLPVVLVEAQAAGLNCIVSDSITKESDVTGRMTFMSLEEDPEKWASKLLEMSTDHIDTSSILIEKGYDSQTMSKWLTDFYLKQTVSS